MTLSVEKQFGTEINNIYNNDDYNAISVRNRGFVSIQKIDLNSILFLGINPSYIDNVPNDSVSYYNLEQANNDYKRYFSKFESISKEIGVNWSHMDLLFIRETQQEAIDKIIKEQNGLQFIWEQLLLSKQILEAAKPQLLVVSNTKARQFLGKDKFNGKNLWLDYDFEFDNHIGTHRITTPDSSLKGIPVFFTSMLSGQRALDNGSFERLVWHIKFALNRSNPNS